jgi:hypothetical protein
MGTQVDTVYCLLTSEMRIDIVLHIILQFDHLFDASWGLGGDSLEFCGGLHFAHMWM